jgi:hypothetical protein
MLTSFLRPIMSDKALAWASKLPLSAAIFVGSVLILLLKSSSMMMQAFVILICGPIYFFHPSMPAVCTPVRFAPVYMAAIVHRYQLLYLRFIYMLQLTITTPRLHTTASSHVYVGMPPMADFILYTLCVPWHTYHWVTSHFRMGTIQVHSISETPVPDPTAVIRPADSDTRSIRRDPQPYLPTRTYALEEHLFRVYQTLQDDKIMPPWDRPRRVRAEVGHQ